MMSNKWFLAIYAICIFFFAFSSLHVVIADGSRQVETDIIGEVTIEANESVNPTTSSARKATSTLFQAGYDMFVRARLGDKDALLVLTRAADQTSDTVNALYGDDDLALTQTTYLMMLYTFGSASLPHNSTKAGHLAEQVSPFLQRQLRSLPETDPDYPYLATILSLVYSERLGFAANDDKADMHAVKYVQAAVDGNIPVAQILLASWYMQGKAQLSKDPSIAVKYYRMAGESGDAYGELFYGLCHYYGHGMDKDQAQALQWFLKSANQGFSEAEYLVGHCYSTGQGVGKVDNVQAVSWYEKAANHGQRDAQFALGYYYNTGMGGKTRNVSQAIHWYTLAADAKHQDAPFFLPAATFIDHITAGIEVIYPFFAMVYPYYEMVYNTVAPFVSVPKSSST